MEKKFNDDMTLIDNSIVEKQGNMSPRAENLDQTLKPRKKGGLWTMPFIILNEAFEKVASYGILPNMILYLINGYHLEAANSTIILSLWSAASNVMAIFGAFLSDSYLGRFRVISLGTLSSLLGTILLWLTAMVPSLKPPPCSHQPGQHCETATSPQYLFLFCSFALLSIGAGCVRPCSIAFGADQISNKDNPNNDRMLDSFFHWYYASTGFSTILALTLIVYIQDDFGWKIGFGVPAILMILSFIAFLGGSPLYVHVKAKSSVLAGLFQVPVAAFKKRKARLSTENSPEDECFFYANDSKIKAPTDDLRYLNRACLVKNPEKELTSEGSAKNAWTLCTVEQVQNLKAVCRIMPIWSTGIMMLVALNSSYVTLQAKTMDRHINSGFQIPAGTFQVFSIVTITLWVGFYDRAVVPLLKKFFGLPRGLKPTIRMGLGLLVAVGAMIVAAIVEAVRRKNAIKQGLQNKPHAEVDMSAMWLIPQLVLLGLAEGLNAVGQIEFYYSQLSKTMSSLAMAIFTLGFAVSSIFSSILVELINSLSAKGGKVSWLATDLNQGHVDYYYWMLAILELGNFLYFLVICWFCMPPKRESKLETDDDLGEE